MTRGSRNPVSGATTPLKTPAQRLAEGLSRQGIHEPALLAAVGRIPRHQFVDDAFKARAYELQSSLPIGFAQTISQPAVVAMMTQTLLEGGTRRRVLEVGTGSGYQTALLAELCEVVFTVERVKALTEQARKRLAALGYRNVHFGYADGMQGWLPYAPYDGILVTAAAAELPPGLPEQLAPGGRLVIPVGPPGAQVLKVIDRGVMGFRQRDIATVSFVPLLAGKV
ncbi:protein-L-isoaspartate(D-aspartate) O-methyltransferase [Flagellatimonas centrodinii]|uniref:protein-L-isoaspartate(D-aspartate) O-methyltransferase n=1 Tax=Flagellatimonas centrodinii TaxID=2806210 RepID=UPI001FFBDE19|nr:protein-L-isoaspartate(D-aspartate) O-methyltransferase [Flagellatimonas centrodinii]ULQ46143.1 protein-L-isoaspartate(D-aspartate) O-methyltransferase [Flagellatimonas centrodinii]